jgi:esterase/lipase superfamily enzyme
MHREYHKWFSPQLGRDMELLVFGHGGLPVIVFSSSQGRFYEFEERHMVASVGHKVDAGEVQFFCLDSVDGESWYNRAVPPRWRIARQIQYQEYVLREVVPLARQKNSNPRMITLGCSFGGYHAVNVALRHPDLVTYAVSMSGAFDIPPRFLDGYYDTNAYFHSPLDYLPNLNEEGRLVQLRRNYCVLAVGNHDPLFDQNVKLAHALGSKGIPHVLDVWEGFGHDWPWWYKMAEKFFL